MRLFARALPPRGRMAPRRAAIRGRRPERRSPMRSDRIAAIPGDGTGSEVLGARAARDGGR